MEGKGKWRVVTFYDHLKAINDHNGNPRRLFVVRQVVLDLIRDEAQALVIDIIDEEFLGVAAVKQKYPDAIPGETIRVSVKEYLAWRRKYAILKGKKLVEE